MKRHEMAEYQKKKKYNAPCPPFFWRLFGPCIFLLLKHVNEEA
jgi:hypothetical protein